MNISGEKPVIKSCIFCDRPQRATEAFWPGNKWKYNGSTQVAKQDKGLCQAARCLNKQLLQRSDSTFIC